MENPKLSITNLIYTKLFGMTQFAMIDYAAYHFSTQFNNAYLIHGFNVDEMMRDCLSLESLQALNEIEETCAVFISNSAQYLQNGKITPEQWQDSVVSFIETTVDAIKAKMGTFEVWGDNRHD